jgi:hypothetical protein
MLWVVASRPVIKARRLLLVMPVRASRVWQSAPARAWTRGSPNRGAGARRRSRVTVGVRDPQRLDSRGRNPGRRVEYPAVGTLVFAAPRYARAFFEALVADNLDIGRPEQLEVIFNRRTRGPIPAHGRLSHTA